MGLALTDASVNHDVRPGKLLKLSDHGRACDWIRTGVVRSEHGRVMDGGRGTLSCGEPRRRMLQWADVAVGCGCRCDAGLCGMEWAELGRAVYVCTYLCIYASSKLVQGKGVRGCSMSETGETLNTAPRGDGATFPFA